MHENGRIKKQLMKDAYIEAVKLSGIEKSDLMTLHNINKNILDKWLFVPERYPTFEACYELHLLLSASNIQVPHKLMSVITNRSSVVNALSKKYIQLSSPGGGKVKRPSLSKRQLKRYVYNGKLVTVNELATLTGRKTYGIYIILSSNSIEDGDDVTEIMSRKRSLRTKNVIYKGTEYPSMKELAEHLGLPYDYVKGRYYRKRNPGSNDLSHIDFSKYHREEKDASN
ncbi:hypothetical protein IM880_12940 [Pectobacterium polaris]|uniref:Uncharacterized protein n=1 Tax=Pectobacterium polaris TaxID=2042057 RepID=A0AAW4P1A1_9GAMM|nr:hypothetical protein [Pectobacterium polaris]MBW5893121.1 hypothetical protein [Pectobacterium polaris]